jgi:hypothetical protein
MLSGPAKYYEAGVTYEELCPHTFTISENMSQWVACHLRSLGEENNKKTARKQTESRQKADVYPGITSISSLPGRHKPRQWRKEEMPSPYQLGLVIKQSSWYGHDGHDGQ